QEYLSITNHVYTPAGLLINEDKWNGLTDEQQDIIMEAAEAGRDINRDLNEENDEKLIEELEEKGMEVNEISDITPFQELSTEVWDMLIEDLGEEAEEIIENIMDSQR